jgi:hypothetical protein
MEVAVSTPESFFGGAAGLSWPKANNGVYTDTKLRGVVRGGLVVSDPKVEPMTDMATGEPIYWDAAKTRQKEQLVVELLCDGRGGALDERDRQNPHDDGKRRLYVRGYMVTAIRDALGQTGSTGITRGGELYVAWIDEKPAKTRGFDPARVWAAKYVPPTVAVPQGGGTVPQNGLSGAPATDPFGAAQPAAQPATAPAGAASTPFGAPAPTPHAPASPFTPPAPAPTPAANPFG